ncbi:MAG: hypothetical protein AAB815_02200 [Patescibacteria group bacterium]
MRNKNLFIGVAIFLAFISIGVFGLLQFSHTNHATEAPMINCPYVENGYSICESTFNHINNWRQFSNVIIPALFIFSLLILGIVLSLFGKQNFLNQERYFYKWEYYLYNKQPHTYQEKITKWLSLFENSPTLSYKA